ncbi:MAG: tetratricopeptide repeat protein [Deltaproteobacteria bacterium]|nr:tetratricopeptide repeat protein [Deltaproteobacteria bacterium]
MDSVNQRYQQAWLFLLGLIFGTAIFFSYSCYPQQQRPLPGALPKAGGEPTSLEATYRTLLQGETAEKRRELFRMGYHLLQEKDRPGARLFLSRALEVYPPLADYSLYFLGVLNREDGRNDEARAAFLRLLEQYAQSIWVSHATLELASIAVAAKDWDSALRYAQAARDGHNVRPSIKNTAALVLAQAYEGRGESATAYARYQEVRRTTPSSPVGKIAKEQVERLRALDAEQFALRSEQDYLTEMQLCAKERDSKGVETLAAQFSDNFPASSQQVEVLSLLATTYKSQRQNADAIRVWRDLADRFPTTSTGSTALFRAATLLWNNNQDDEALALFQRITQAGPRHAQADDAWYAIGRIYQERKDEENAMAAFDRLATLFPGTQLAREGRWRQAWLAYRRKDFAVAETRFSSLARSAANTTEGESALYWQARAIEQQGRSDQATETYRQLLRRYPDSYYTVWVEKRLGETPSSLPNVDDDMDMSPPPMASTTESHYIKSLELRQLGLPGLAQKELDLVRADLPQNTTTASFLLREYPQVEGHHRALRFAQGLGSSRWRYVYPQAYWSTVSEHARTKRLDPYLILSIMRQESVFDPDAVSPAQAHGLMQLLPSTASRVSGITPESSLPLSDPAFNIQTGASYLRQLLDRYNENVVLAVAAYNGGEEAVDRWLRRYPGLAPDEFAELISYRETRNYVRQVLKNYRTYLRLYSSGAIPDIAG